MPTLPGRRYHRTTAASRSTLISTHGQTVRILHLTDLHLFADSASELRGCNTDASLNAVIGDYHSRDWRADITLVTGDLVQDDTAAAYERCKRHLADLPGPIQLCPGNHDVPERMAAVFDAPAFTIGAATDIGHWRCIALSTFVEGSAAGALSDTELERLRLACDTDRHVLVALHHPPVELGSRWLDELMLDNADALLAITRQHDNIRGLVFGHAHQPLDTTLDGTRLLCTPSTCRQFRPGSDSFAVDDEPPAYRRLELEADGGIRSEVIRVNLA